MKPPTLLTIQWYMTFTPPPSTSIHWIFHFADFFANSVHDNVHFYNVILKNSRLIKNGLSKHVRWRPKYRIFNRICQFYWLESVFLSSAAKISKCRRAPSLPHTQWGRLYYHHNSQGDGCLSTTTVGGRLTPPQQLGVQNITTSTVGVSAISPPQQLGARHHHPAAVRGQDHRPHPVRG